LGALELGDEAVDVLAGAADRAPAADFDGVTGGDGIIVDVQADVEDNVHVSAFLSVLSLVWLGTPALAGAQSTFPEADTLCSPIASHSD
jgi:hypothetical protein